MKKGFINYILGIVGILLLFIFLPNSHSANIVKLLWLLMLVTNFLPFYYSYDISIDSKFAINFIVINIIYFAYFAAVLLLSFIYIHNISVIEKPIAAVTILVYLLMYILEFSLDSKLKENFADTIENFDGFAITSFIFYFIIFIAMSVFYPI